MSDSFKRINKGITFRPQSGAPTNPTNGDVYYDNSLQKLRVYQNGAWVNLSDTDGTVLLADGATATPSLAFTNDTDLGLYRFGANQMRVTAGSLDVADFNSSYVRIMSVPLFVDNGTQSAPSYSFTNDQDTGFYAVSADQIGISTGGAFRGRLRSDGLEYTVFYASQDGSTGSASYTFLNDTNTGLYTPSSDVLGVTAGGTGYTFSTTGLTVPTSIFNAVGSVGSPSYTFTGDTDTGIYRSAADQISVSLAGNEEYRFSNIAFSPGTANGAALGTGSLPFNEAIVTRFYAGDGTVAQPAYSFSSDPDTGLHISAANRIDIVSGGVVQLRMNGTSFTIPSGVPFFFSDGAAATPSISFGSSQTTGLFRQAADVIGVSIAGVEKIRTEAAGTRFNTTTTIGSGSETISSVAKDVAVGTLAGAVVTQATRLDNAAITGNTRIVSANLARSITTSQTDTGAYSWYLVNGGTLTIPSGQTYTSSGTYAGFQYSAPTISGSGTAAISAIYGALIGASSTNYGTGKAGIAIGAQSGNTNNVGLLLGTVTIPSGSWGLYSTDVNQSYIAGQLSVNAATASASALFNVGGDALPASLTNTNQIGIQSNILGTSNGTVSVRGMQSFVTTAASTVVAEATSIRAASNTLGSGGTITRGLGLRLDAQTAGTNNSRISDNITFTGNWFLNSADTNPTLLSGPLELKQQATPSNPSSGQNRLYFKSDNNLYKLDSTGAEVLMAAAGSGVTGPGSSTVDAVPRWSNTGGTALANSGVTIDSSNNMVVPGTFRAGAAIGGNNSFNANSSSVYTLWVNNANTTNTAPGMVVVVGQTTAAGGASNALAVYNNAGGAGGDLLFNVSGAGALQLGQVGGAKTHTMYAGDSDTLGASINLNSTAAANTFGIVKDGSTGRLRIAGGGSTNGTHAMLSLYGNAHASLPGRIAFDNVVGTVFSATNTGLVTIGPAASTVSHAVNGHLGITRTVSIGDSAPGNQISLHVSNTNRILTATSQYGQYTNHYTSSAATSAIYGHYLDINTQAASYTTPFVASYVAGAINKGSGHTITRIAAYLSTLGTGNAANSAVLADNTTYTSDWFISNTVNQNTTFALPSTFAGHMGLGGAIDNSTMLNITGGGVSFQADQRAAIAALVSSTAATTSVVGFLSRVTNTAGSYTVSNRVQFDSENPTKGAGSTITRDVGMRLTPPDDGTNNALITDNLSFTGDWSLNLTSQRKSVFGGVLGVGATSPDVALYVGVQSVLFNSATQLYGVLSDGRFPTTATDTAFGFVSSVTSSAAAYTVDKVYGFYAQNPAKGAGSTITRQVQFSGVQPTQGTHNAFLSDSATFSGNYFIHQTGSAVSSFAGNVSFVGQALLQDGTANNPALRWINGNSGLGLYRISDSEVRFTFPDTSIVSISNQGSNDDSVLKLTNTGSSSGDQYVYFIEGALTASQWSFGRDDSDSGSIVLSQSSSPGVNNVLKVNPSLLMTLGSNQSFTIDNGSASFGYSRSASGSNIIGLIENLSNTADSGARLFLNVAGSSGGDPAVNFQIVGEQQFVIGIDNTDNNFKVSSGSTMGGSQDYLTVTNDAAVYMAAGTGDQAGLTGIVFSDTTERANVGAGEDDLGTYTMPANTMRHNGDTLEMHWSGTTASNANGKRFRVYMGTGTAEMDTGALTMNNVRWSIEAQVTRTSSGIWKGIIKFMTSDQTNAPMRVEYVERSITFTGAVTVKLTGEATADGDIVNRNTSAWFSHANP